jgi:predicted transport protein
VIKVYTEDDHLSKVDDNMKELYGDLKSAILSLGKDIELRPKKFYIAFQRKQGFAGLDFLKSNLKVYFNINFFDIQALKNARDVTKVGHHSHGNTEVTITEPGEIPYVSTLIKQAYEKS